jgi:hypothetical protein
MTLTGAATTQTLTSAKARRAAKTMDRVLTIIRPPRLFRRSITPRNCDDVQQPARRITLHTAICKKAHMPRLKEG